MSAADRLEQIPVHIEGAWPGIPSQGRRARKVEGLMVRHRERLAWVHVTMFIGFMVMMVVPLLLPLPGDQARFWNNFSLFCNFVIWGLWFPLVFVSVVFSGRSWCGILCPLGATSEWANRFGLKKPVPGWVRWEGTPIVSFIIITVLAQTISARDFPSGIAEVFGLSFVAAVALGLLYGRGRNKRAWCRHMCPIGLMLGVFSRLGAVQFAPKRPRRGGDLYTEKGLCPTMIDINHKAESRHCIECFRCVRPEGRGGLKLLFRRPGLEIERIREYNPNSAEIWFLFLGTGLSLGGFLWLILPQYQSLRQAVATWFIDQGWYWIGDSGPTWLMSVHPAAREVFTWLDFFMITGYMLAWAVALTAVLFILTRFASGLAGRLGADGDGRSRFVELAYAYMPVAMVSLVIGLGGKLFEALTTVGAPAVVVTGIKAALFFVSVIWSLYLGYRLLGVQGLSGLRRGAALVPGALGIAVVGAAWWPAIF